MRTIVLEQAGSVDNFIYQEVEKPIAGPNEVLVETKAISINPVDYKVRALEPVIDRIVGEERPVVLGWDIAGTVTAIGSQVTDFEVGDRVFGMVNFPGHGKAYAEYVVALAKDLAKIPKNTSFEGAAATTLAALTALQVLESRIKRGDRVLIHAGSGGVGHYAIQIAKHLGAYVITTSSGKNRDFVMGLGADEFIDYRTQKFEEELSDVDFVFDMFNGDILLNSVKIVKEGGAIVSLPTPEFSDEIQALAQSRNVSVDFVLVQSSGKDMNTLKGLLENGAIKAHVSQTFDFSEMGKAHLQLESGRTVGKIVVKL